MKYVEGSMLWTIYLGPTAASKYAEKTMFVILLLFAAQQVIRPANTS